MNDELAITVETMKIEKETILFIENLPLEKPKQFPSVGNATDHR